MPVSTAVACKFLDLVFQNLMHLHDTKVWQRSVHRRTCTPAAAQSRSVSQDCTAPPSCTGQCAVSSQRQVFERHGRTLVLTGTPSGVTGVACSAAVLAAAAD